MRRIKAYRSKVSVRLEHHQSDWISAPFFSLLAVCIFVQ